MISSTAGDIWYELPERKNGRTCPRGIERGLFFAFGDNVICIMKPVSPEKMVRETNIGLLIPRSGELFRVGPRSMGFPNVLDEV